MDILHIKALAVSTKIGIHLWEQKINQSLLIDLSISKDFSQCHEDIAKTIDYFLLCQKVTEFVQSRSFKLIETVANEVAELILNEWALSQVTVAVTKPHAVANAGTIQVVVVRPQLT